MSNSLINRLRALLRALILVLLLGTGLWLMDKISQESMAGRMHPANSRTSTGMSTPASSQQASSIPAITEPKSIQDQADSAAISSRKPQAPPGSVPEGNAADPAKKGPAAQATLQPKDGAATAPQAMPAPGAKEATGVGALPRIASRAGGEYIVTEPILFNTAMATIRQISVPSLKAISTLLKQRPEIKVLIIGYTDNLGQPENNLRVSNERASAVREFLVGQGIDPTRLEAKGMGSQNPIASNDTQMGRQANRRIEFLIASQK